MRKVTLHLFLFFLIAITSVKPGLAQEYIWPTEASPYLSSTFGETRAAHFHAGLDIKTWGQEGYRVFASREGNVHRLVMTERGYGRAIYLKHPDGTYTLYAHLQRFNDKLQALADSLRIQNNYKAELDVTLDSLDIHFEQGEVIGYSGSTGIGPPHLHFEIRDTEYRPVNALTSNLSVPDDIPPVFQSIIVEPINKDSRVNGNPYSDFKRAAKLEDGTYTFGTYDITGEAGLAVNVYDQANRVTNSYAVYELYLVHGTDTLFYERLDGYDYEDAAEMFLNRIAPFRSGRRGHQRMYYKEGSNNPFLIRAEENAKITPDDSLPTYTLIAKDYYGNTSKARISFKKDQSFPGTPLKLNLPASEWYWNENWVSPDLTNTLNLRNLNMGFPWQKDQRILYAEDSTIYNIARIIPEETTEIETPDRQMKVTFFGDEFHDTLSVAASYSVNKENDEVQISVAPDVIQSRSDYQIQFFLGNKIKTGSNYHLYRKKDRDDFSFVDSEVRGGTLHASPGDLGTFVIKEDTEIPVVGSFRIIKTDYGKWLGVASTRDELSGISSETAEFYINGIQGIAEYDYEEELLIYTLPDFNPQAQNTATIIISDQAGNQTSVTKEFQFPASASP